MVGPASPGWGDRMGTRMTELGRIKRLSAAERMTLRVTPGPSGCLDYPLHRGHRYGTIGMSGRHYQAHVAAWIITNGPVPDGLKVCHTCDRPSCVNVAHLFLGTQAENMQDCIAKGRNAVLPGEDNPYAKLTEDDVRSIRAKRALGIRLVDVASEFNISIASVSRITRRTSWSHI